jgi:hypothetical protein
MKREQNSRQPSHNGLRAFFFRASLIDHKHPTADLFAWQTADGCSAFSDVVHCHEREASRVTGRSIFNEADSGDGSELLEAGPKIRFGRLGGEVSNIEFHGLISIQTIANHSSSRGPSFKSRLRNPRMMIYRASN